MTLRIPLVATATIAAVLIVAWLAAHVAADRKLAAIGPLDGAPGSYRITLDFAPERFHQQVLQDAGRLVEVRNRTVYMKDVAPAALRRIAGAYWVDRVDRWDGR